MLWTDEDRGSPTRCTGPERVGPPENAKPAGGLGADGWPSNGGGSTCTRIGVMPVWPGREGRLPKHSSLVAAVYLSSGPPLGRARPLTGDCWRQPVTGQLRAWVAKCAGHGPLTRRVTTQGWTSGKMGCFLP